MVTRSDYWDTFSALIKTALSLNVYAEYTADINPPYIILPSVKKDNGKQTIYRDTVTQTITFEVTVLGQTPALVDGYIDTLDSYLKTHKLYDHKPIIEDIDVSRYIDVDNNLIPSITINVSYVV